MNSQQHLRSWIAEWTTYQTLAATPAHQPPPPDPTAVRDSGNRYTVGNQGDIAGIFLDRLNAAILPDDAQRSARDGRYNVLARSGSTVNASLLRGQIRQLNPDLKPAWTRPVQVLVLNIETDRERALVAPFSLLSVPAFEAELATTIDDESLAVLCLWNATWMPLRNLAHSWVLMDGGDELMQDAALLRQSLARKEPLTPTLQARTGPPLIHPHDPRQVYVDAEEDLLEDLHDDL